MDIKKIIQDDREAKVKSKFEGTFLDYLDIIMKNPDNATTITILSSVQKYVRLLDRAKKNKAVSIPMAAPWLASPPFQTIRISPRWC